MPAAIDMEYCLIVIDKLISPSTPPEHMKPLFRDLMDSVYHQEMKDLVQRIVDPSLDITKKRELQDQFRNFDHGGDNDYSGIDYKDLIDKLIDPNLPDLEYKPSLKAMLEGGLDQEKKNLVTDIISCQNANQKAQLVRSFKALFDREKEEKERAKKGKLEAKEAKKRAKAELEANLLKFNDDGMTLINKLLDIKIPNNLKSQIYNRLMEPDIDAEIKNLAIQLLEPDSERPKLLEEFKKRRELENMAAAKTNHLELVAAANRKDLELIKQRKEEDSRRKVEEENMKHKQQQELKKMKDIVEKRMKRKESHAAVVAPSSVQECVKRKKREDIEDNEDIGDWVISKLNPSDNNDFLIRLPDLGSSLEPSERQEYKAALADLFEDDEDSV